MSPGYTSLCRITAAEKEELKRKEKELRRCRFTDDSILLTSHVQYTLGLHHQVSAGSSCNTLGFWHWSGLQKDMVLWVSFC